MIARILFTAAHALFWAATDARDIRNGKNINHPVRWTLRAAIEVVASLVTMPIGWETALVTIAAAFLFSALFRFLLNTMRGRHWRYIAPWSNRYDHLMWSIPNFFKAEPWDWIEYGIRYHQGNAMRQKTIHRAGTLAYIFEVVVFAILTFTASVA